VEIQLQTVGLKALIFMEFISLIHRKTLFHVVISAQFVTSVGKMRQQIMCSERTRILMILQKTKYKKSDYSKIHILGLKKMFRGE